MVERVEPAETIALIDLQTSAKTFIAGGFVSHNCPVKAACFAKAGVEKRFVPSRYGPKPAWFIGRDAWDTAGLEIHSPPSLTPPAELTVPALLPTAKEDEEEGS